MWTREISFNCIINNFLYCKITPEIITQANAKTISNSKITTISLNFCFNLIIMKPKSLYRKTLLNWHFNRPKTVPIAFKLFMAYCSPNFLCLLIAHISDDQKIKNFPSSGLSQRTYQILDIKHAPIPFN